jgi:predicted permease
LSAAWTGHLSRLVADVAFPALCFRGITRAQQVFSPQGIAVMALGFLTHFAALLLGWAMAGWLGLSGPVRRAFAFCVAVGNWIFLPLPMGQALYGVDGTTIVLLHNIGAQIFLWTAGMAMLRGHTDVRDLAVGMVRNVGLWATGLGLLVVFGGLTTAPSWIPTSLLWVLGAALEALAMATVPLALLAIGAQLAEAPEASQPWKPVLGIVVGRLAVAPALIVAGLIVARSKFGFPLGPVALHMEALISLMPVSVTAGALTLRYDVEPQMTARAIALATLTATVTVPLAHGGLLLLGI